MTTHGDDAEMVRYSKVSRFCDHQTEPDHLPSVPVCCHGCKLTFEMRSIMVGHLCHRHLKEMTNIFGGGGGRLRNENGKREGERERDAEEADRQTDKVRLIQTTTIKSKTNRKTIQRSQALVTSHQQPIYPTQLRKLSLSAFTTQSYIPMLAKAAGGPSGRESFSERRLCT